MPVDIHTGVTDEMATELAEFLGFKGELVPQCAEQIKNLYTMFLDVDCLQLEVNPLAETPQGKVSYILIGSSGSQYHKRKQITSHRVNIDIGLTLMTQRIWQGGLSLDWNLVFTN